MSPDHTPKITLGANRWKKISLAPETLYYWSAHVFLLIILFRVLVPLPQQSVFYFFFPSLIIWELSVLTNLLPFHGFHALLFWMGMILVITSFFWVILSIHTCPPESIVTFLFILQLLSNFYLHHHLPFLCSLHHSTFYRSRYWYWRVPLLFPPYLYICSPSLLESV